MTEKERIKEKLRDELINILVRMGYPAEFGYVIAAQLGTRSTMQRMIGYLRSAKPRSAEEIADEALSICDDRDRWISRKKSEYYNARYNELLFYGMGTDDEDE